MSISCEIRLSQWATTVFTLALLAVLIDSTLIQPRRSPAFVLSNTDEGSNNDQVIGANVNFNQSLHKRNLTARDGSAVPVYTTCSTPGSFSLTFDDGPSEFSANLDATLDASNAKASFFINGNNIGCIYDYAGLLVDRFNKGHLIASHTWSHVHCNQGNYQQLSYQLELIENASFLLSRRSFFFAMIKILGVKPLYFRPPYGSLTNSWVFQREYNDLVVSQSDFECRKGCRAEVCIFVQLQLQVLHDRGYKGLIMWSQDTADSLDAPASSSGIIESYRSYPEQTNVLNHETKSLTVNEVSYTKYNPNSTGQRIQLTNGKIVLISLVEDTHCGLSIDAIIYFSPSCLNLGTNPSDWYVSVQQPGTRDDSWTCNGTPGPESFT
ncbi:hypothetical protein MJO28_012871 [Puccinia striiformis f. sp. tritici]|uniref:Uncharacterized protein n=1 Tax=Puccinia striiformis f. sp. tritici TaxID=168172 RepID=A0ACC0DWY0_9BASI|nr:hypothetical protein MJO28_012871 [Puccinia striiformis f. sp. tritici]